MNRTSMKQTSQFYRMNKVGMKKAIWLLAALMGCLMSVRCEAAIAVRGSSTAYYRSTTQYTVGMALPMVVGVGTVASAVSGNVTLTLPSGIAAGDLLLCMVESHDNAAPTFPTGWTRLYRNQPGMQYSTAWYKSATATEVSPTVTHATASSGGGSIIAQCSAYRNVLLAAPTYSGVASTGANVKTGTVTTTLANQLMLMAVHLNQGATTTSGWSMSVPGGLTWTPQFASTTTLGSGTPVAGSSLGLYSATKATAGSQTALTATIAGTVNSSSLNYGVLFGLKFGLGINKPSGTAAGDLMVLSIAARSSNATITPPAGWTLLLSNTETTTPTTTPTSKLSTYYKIAGASEPASYNWSSGTSESVASLVSFSGVDATTPFDGVTPLGTPNTSATTTQTAPSITPASSNDWLVTVHEQASTPCSTSFASGWTPPTGMTERVDTCSRTPSSTSGMGMEVATLALSTAGVATGTKAATAAANAARGISQSMVLKPAAAVTLDHIEIDYPAPPFSTCAPTPVTVYACANAACSNFFTGGASVTLSPGGSGVNIPSGSGSGAGTVFQGSASSAVLSAVSVPSSGATVCKNTSTSAFNCNVTFSATSLSVSVPNLVSGNSVTGTVSGCTAQLPIGANSINLYTSYQDPVSGSKQASINGTALATSSPGTAVSLNFDGASPISSGSFSLSYPDVGKLGLTAVKASATGSVSFVAVPHHFAPSSITCGNGSTYVGCSVASPYANPAASDASGAAFMKAGYPFSITVAAYNSAGAITPNFGRESTPESVNLTVAANMADLAGAVTGNLTGSLGVFNAGSASGNNFVYDEVGIITLTPTLRDPDAQGYLSIGTQALNPMGSASGNIGRFIPDHFEVNPDPLDPILPRADLPQTTALATGTTAPANVINVDTTTVFFVGSTVRIAGAGAGGIAFTATVTAVDPVGLTLTLDASIGTSLVGGESVLDEWGGYMGEPMNANFILTAVDAASNVTNNYQGVYAKLNLAAGSNPLGLGAMDATGPTYNLLLDTSVAPTGSFSKGIATISAPFVAARGSTAVGPYNVVKIGIAPTSAEADGVKMGAYDLSVAGGANDHTSIMDPLVQSATQLRYGRLKISNAYGSELLTLPVGIAAQYFDGTTWVTNVQDSLSTPGGPLTYLAVTGTPLCTGLAFAAAPVKLVSGMTSFTLTRPSNGRCSADIALSLPSYLPSVSARVTFGIYKSPLIYRRENY
jgi:hypothetical protein